MKTCLRLTIFMCLLPMLATAAEQLVQVPPCCEGNTFTIRIPVRFPDSVQYAWYRNDTLIAGTEATQLPDENAIAYTVPVEDAHGSAVYHFKYHLEDGYAAWTSSPKYLITFMSSFHLSAITGDTMVCWGGQEYVYAVADILGVTYNWTLPAGWTITAGNTTNRITVVADTASGTVSVTPTSTTTSCVDTTPSTLAVRVGNQAPTIVRSGGAASQTVCSGTAITNIRYTRNNIATGFATISWSPSTPAGITASISGAVYTISGTPAEGVYKYTIKTTGQPSLCAAAEATGTISRGGIGSANTISVDKYSCSSSGIASNAAHTISVAPYTSSACSSGGVVGSINIISVDPDTSCSSSIGGIGSVNTISVSPAY